MGVLRKKATGEILAKTHPALEEVPGGSKRRSAEGRSTTAARSLPKAGSDDNSAWGQKVRDMRGMRKRLDGKTAGASAKGGLSGGTDARTAQSEIKRLNEEAASPASYLGPSFAQNRRYQQVKELEKDSGAYSLGTSLKGMAAKGMEQIAMAGGDALAFGEDVLLAPVEVLSGMQLGDLSDTAPMNTWAKSIRKEAEGVKQKYQANMEKGGTPARLLEEVGASVIAAVPQAAAAMLTGGGSAAAQTTAGLARTAAAQASPGVGAAVARAAGSMAKNPLYWSSFARTVGGDYENALRDQRELEVQRAAKALISGTPYQPASENEIRTRAALYAIGTGLANAAVEVSGGLETLPGELKGGGAWAALRDSMAHEGGEEVIQGSLGRGLKNAVYDAGAPVFSVRDENAILNPVTAMKEFAGGAAVGGILGGAQMGIGNAVRRIRENSSYAKGATKNKDAQSSAQSPMEIFAEVQAQTTGQQITAPENGTATVNENGLTALTQLERENLSSGKKNKIVSTFREAVSFVQNALRNEQSKERAYLGKVPDSVAQMVLEQTGADIRGYNALMFSDSVRHMFKDHGDPIKEASMGQIPVSPEAVSRIPDVLSNPDRVSMSPHKDRRGLPVLLFEKKIGGYYITAQAISDGTHSIQADTLYIKKKAPQDAVSNIGEIANPEHNVRNVLPQEPFGDTSVTEDDFTITGVADFVKSGLGSQIDATDPVKLYQQLLTEASTAKRIETLAEYYRKYVGDPSGRGAKGVDPAAVQALERAYREAMGLGQYEDETVRELKRLYEQYLGKPMGEMEDED